MENQELIKQVTEKAEKWLTPAYDAETQAEVKKLLENPDKTDLIEAFYKDLEFGTGGLRFWVCLFCLPCFWFSFLNPPFPWFLPPSSFWEQPWLFPLPWVGPHSVLSLLRWQSAAAPILSFLFQSLGRSLLSFK